MTVANFAPARFILVLFMTFFLKYNGGGGINALFFAI